MLRHLLRAGRCDLAGRGPLDQRATRSFRLGPASLLRRLLLLRKAQRVGADILALHIPEQLGTRARALRTRTADPRRRHERRIPWIERRIGQSQHEVLLQILGRLPRRPRRAIPARHRERLQRLLLQRHLRHPRQQQRGPGIDLAVMERLARLVTQREQREPPLHVTATAPDAGGDVLDAKPMLTQERLIALGLGEFIQVLALQVLDQLQLTHVTIRERAHQRRNTRQARRLRRTPAPLAGHDLERRRGFTRDRPNHDGLQYAVRLDARDQFAQRLAIELTPPQLLRGGGGRGQRLQRQMLQRALGRNSGCNGIRHGMDPRDTTDRSACPEERMS